MNIVQRYMGTDEHIPYRYKDVREGDYVRILQETPNAVMGVRFAPGELVKVSTVSRCSQSSLDDCEQDGDICPSHGVAIIVELQHSKSVATVCDCRLANKYGIELSWI